MTSLELIVRPFQTRDVTPPVKIVPTKPVAVDAPVLLIGSSGGQVIALTAQVALEFNVDDKNTYKEIKRDTTTRRVTNPDDSSQFVDVELINKLYLQNKVDPKNKPIYELKNT